LERENIPFHDIFVKGCSAAFLLFRDILSLHFQIVMYHGKKSESSGHPLDVRYYLGQQLMPGRP
jgi:hypothetical protein